MRRHGVGRRRADSYGAWRWGPLGLCLMGGSAQAHLLGGTGGEFSWLAVDPLALVLLGLTAWWYARGTRALRERGKGLARAACLRRRCFWWGWGALALVLGTPLDALGEQLFSVHMVQHEVLMLVAAPLLVLSRPSSALLHGAPRWVGRTLGVATRGGSGFWRALSEPFAAWTFHLLVLWAWHLPALFSAGLRNGAVHTLQHVSFLLAALLFWWALLRGPARGNGGLGVLYLFTTAVHAGLLGALLTFSPRPWYVPYEATAPAWGLSALEDQQLGGLIMWVPGCAVFIVGALWVLGRALSERDAAAREAGEAGHG